MAAVYERKIHISKVLKINDSDAKISFYKHAGTLSTGSIFRLLKKRDEIWSDFVNNLCVDPAPPETKQKKFEKFVLENVIEKFLYGRIKTDAFFFFIVLNIQRDFLLFVKRLPV